MFRIPARPGAPGPWRWLRAALGFAALLAGALFLQVGHALRGLGQLWGGPRTAVALDAMLAHFARAAARQRANPGRSPGWEQRLQRVGPVVILSIVAVWMCAVLLALFGGAIAWLVLHGHGAWLLGGCVLLGTALGLWLAHVGAKSPHNTHLN